MELFALAVLHCKTFDHEVSPGTELEPRPAHMEEGEKAIVAHAPEDDLLKTWLLTCKSVPKQDGETLQSGGRPSRRTCTWRGRASRTQRLRQAWAYEAKQTVPVKGWLSGTTRTTKKGMAPSDCQALARQSQPHLRGPAAAGPRLVTCTLRMQSAASAVQKVRR